MTQYLKGNYSFGDEAQSETEEEKPADDLETRFERAALARLGGSICFVHKAHKFVWSGEEDGAEASGKADS